jgi:hypothetical protein
MTPMNNVFAARADLISDRDSQRSDRTTGFKVALAFDPLRHR